MKARVLDFLSCPACGRRLRVDTVDSDPGELRDGTLACTGCGASYPVRHYIPRLVQGLNYSDSWGMLWRETGEILRDSFTSLPFHRNALHGSYDESSNALAGDRSPFGFGWPSDLSPQSWL